MSSGFNDTGRANNVKDDDHPANRAESPWFGWFLIALPLAGAALGPWFVGGESSWIVKSAVGFLFGVGFAGIAWKGQLFPPLSTIVAAAGVTSFFLGVAVVAVASALNPASTIIVASVVCAAMFWALTR
jgi:hypothetical protein